ncbi:hypothetical protein WA588_001693 [Blastocystis sp. NMH]
MDTTGAAMQILQQFESAFSDFLNPNTPQDQRNAIDQAFMNFEKQSDSWEICLEMMKMTNNPRIHLVIQDTFIYLLKHRWGSLSVEQKSRIQDTEIAFYMNQFNNYPNDDTIKRLTAKTIAWISVMESDRYLQSILDFIASGLHSTSDCSRQLLLLLVLLEEIYETGNAIPLLTEKKSTIQSIIKGSVSDITSSVTSLLGSYSSSSEETICLCLEILMILISQNELSLVLDPALLDVLFKLIYDSSSPLSLSAMQCVNELLMKRLIPYSCRDTYGRLVASLATLLAVTPLLPSHQSLTPSLPLVDPLYLKRLNLLLYQLVAHYLPAIASSPRFPCIDFLRALVDYTCAQTDPRGYLQLLIVWNETLDFLTGANWDEGEAAGLPRLLEFVTRALLLRNGVSVVASAEATEEFLEDSEDIVETGLISAAEPVDEVTGDVEDIPAGEEEPRTELDHVLFRSMGVVAKIVAIPSVGRLGSPALLSLAREALEGALQLLESGRENELSRDESTMLRLMRFLDFGDASVSLLGLLARVIHECHVGNVYIFGRQATQFYIDALRSFKQLVSSATTHLANADIEGILVSLYETLTRGVTVPPTLLLFTISDVLIFVASSCRVASPTGLPFLKPLIENFLKETASCPLVIQRQLLLFVVFLVTHSLPPSEYSPALQTLFRPLLAGILDSRGNSVATDSTFTRCAFLLAGALKEAVSMPKSVKDVLFPPLLPLFLRLAQRLANQNESSQRYEALRVAWNCLLRVAAILRGIRGTHGEFLPAAAALLQMLPAILPRVGTAGKSFVWELQALKDLRLANLLCQDRAIPAGFLTSVVALLTQVGETALRSASTEVAAMFVECCATLFATHSTALTRSPEVLQYVLVLSRLLYAVLAAETAPQELLGAVLAIYRNTGMLTVYKAPGFRAELRQSLSVVLLQHLLAGVHETLAADMVTTLYTINFADFSAFYESDVPLFLGSISCLSKEDREHLAWELAPVSDMPSFQSMIKRFIKDIRIYTTSD